MRELFCFAFMLLTVLSSFNKCTGARRQYQIQQYPTHRDRYHLSHVPVAAAASQHVTQIVGYHYPVPASTNIDPQIQPAPQIPVEIVVEERTTNSPTTTMPTTKTTTLPPPSTLTTTMKPKVKIVPSTMLVAKKPMSIVLAQALSAVTESPLDGSSAEDNARLLHAHHSPQIQTIDVACGKEKMTVRVTFDQEFNGVIYAKGHYNDPNCRFTSTNQGQKIYQFEMVVGQCGVAFIDSGLTSGGQAYVEGMLVIILEPGVQEAWDAARKIRCLWEGNIDQTVTVPLAINMLESQTLTFSGDTASAALEIQTGRGPRAPSVQGLVQVGELLTAVVSVQGDPDFDLLVRNCVATDGTPNNRIILSDNRGCAVKSKLMGGWQKQRNSGSISAYSYLSAFKFPDVMDLFLECTVSLCKGACEECPEYLELHVPSHDHADESQPTGPEEESTSTSSPLPLPQQSKIDIRTTARISKRRTRSAEERQNDKYNETVSPESLRLRRVVHVVGPDDLPERAFQGQLPIYGGGYAGDCFSILGILTAITVTFSLMLILLAIFGILRRQLRNEKC